MIQFTGFIAVNVIFRGVLLDRRRQDERELVDLFLCSLLDKTQINGAYQSESIFGS